MKDDIDLAILDIAMPRMTGLQAARELAARRPELRMLILSMHDNEQYLFEALKAGASGYVAQVRRRPRPRRGVPRRDARRAVPLRRRGHARSSATTSQRARDGETPPEDPLTPREQEIVKLIAESHTNRQIAEAARRSARRRSSATARTSSRSSACATASS